MGQETDRAVNLSNLVQEEVFWTASVILQPPLTGAGLVQVNGIFVEALADKS